MVYLSRNRLRAHVDPLSCEVVPSMYDRQNEAGDFNAGWFQARLQEAAMGPDGGAHRLLR